MSQVRLFEDDTILYRKIQSQSETNIFQENVDHLEGESRLSSSAPSVAEFSERLRRRPRTPVWSWRKTSTGDPTTIPPQLLERDQRVRLSKPVRESITVQTKCYKGIARPVLEYASSVRDPRQKHLQDKLEMVQRKSSAVPPVPLPCRANKL